MLVKMMAHAHHVHFHHTHTHCGRRLWTKLAFPVTFIAIGDPQSLQTPIKTRVWELWIFAQQAPTLDPKEERYCELSASFVMEFPLKLRIPPTTLCYLSVICRVRYRGFELEAAGSCNAFCASTLCAKYPPH